MPYRFEGYYMGNCSPGGRKSLHIRDYLRFDNESLLKNYIEIESCFTSPEPSVAHLTADGEVAFSAEWRDEKELSALETVHREAMRYARTFFDIFYREGALIDPRLPEEMFAAEGCHWVSRQAVDDWTASPIPMKPWEV